MSPGAFTPDDPVWTSYALGEVPPKEKESLTASLRFSTDAEAQVDRVRLSAENLRAAWVAEQVEILPLDSAPFVDGVMAEAGAAVPAAGGGFSLPFLGAVPSKYVILGFAVIVAVGGGGLAWELKQEPRPAMLRWIPVLGSEAGATPVASSTSGDVVTTVEPVPATASAPVPATPPPPQLGEGSFNVRAPDTTGAAVPASATSPAPATPVPAQAATSATAQPAPPPDDGAEAAARAARKEKIDRLREQVDATPSPAPAPALPVSVAPAAFPDLPTDGTPANATIQTETTIPLSATPEGGISFLPGPLRPVRQSLQTGFALAEIVPVVPVVAVPVALVLKDRTDDGAPVEEGGGVRLIDYSAGNDALPTPPPVPFVMMARLFPSPWALSSSSSPASGVGRQLLVVGLRAVTPAQVPRPPANLVFVVDNSLSMGAPDRLAAFKKAVGPFLDRLVPGDRVGLVTYAGSSTIALSSTEIPKAKTSSDAAAAPALVANAPAPGEDEARAAIRAAFNRIAVVGADRPGVSLRAAFDMARKGFLPDGFNRVIVVTDGDLDSLAFGQKDGSGGLPAEVARQTRDGITLSVLFLGKEAVDGPQLRKVVAAGHGRGSILRTAAGIETVLGREVAPRPPTPVRDVKLELALAPEAIGAWRLIGYENHLPVSGAGIPAKEGDGLLAFYELQRPATAAPVDLTARFRYDRPAAAGGGTANGKESLRLDGLTSAMATREVSPQVLREFDKSAAEIRARLAALSPDSRAGGLGSRSADTSVPVAASGPASAPSTSGDSADAAYQNFRKNTEEWLGPQK